MRTVIGCRYKGIDKDYSIEDLAAFHGHLGPFIVIGYRMGRYIRNNFCPDPFRLKAFVYCSGNPPESCIADGVQIGSGCTFGKRNIEIVKSDEIKGEFIFGEKKLVIRPRPLELPKASGQDYDVAIEQFAESLYYMPDSELFVI